MLFQDTKLCLCMIVRNESKVIVRLLDSLLREDKPVISYISILDTGSTDNTKELIEHWGQKHEVPTKVHSKRFVNFGESRSLSFRLAKESFPSDYILLLDADFELHFETINNPKLTHDSYLVKQRNEVIEYWNVRLVKTKLDWKCVGVTHEYWEASKAKDQARCYELLINDKEDGGCKDDKFIRDTKLLLAGIKNKKTPDNLRTRYYFYLAQTYKDRQMYTESIQYYKKRMEQGGWPEEVFFSIFQMAHCMLLSKREADAIVTYLDAWEFRPSRIEPLLSVITYYRQKGKNQLAYTFAMAAKEVPMTDDVLFVDRRCWDYLVDYEISIVAFYCGKKKEGKEALDRVLASSAPEQLKASCRDNLKFYEE